MARGQSVPSSLIQKDRAADHRSGGRGDKYPVDGIISPVSRRRLPAIVLLGTNAISLFGSQLSALALPWFVLETTGSPARAGVVAFAEGSGFLLAGAFAGPLVDRHGYRQISVGSDLTSALAVGLVPLLYHTVGLAFWQLLLLSFAAALFQSPGYSARARIVPELAVLANIRLERLNAAAEMAYHVTLLAGPPLSGLLIAGIGPSDVLAVDAATFALSAGLIAAAIPPHLLPPATRGRYLAELAAGLRFLRQDRLLVPLTISLALGTALVNAPLIAVVLPVYARDTFGSATKLGLLFSSFAAGALAGAALFSAIGSRMSWRWLWIIRFVLMALPYWALAVESSLAMALAALAACGAANGATNPLLVTVRFRRTPPELRGRVFGPLRVIGDLAPPIGVLLAGAAIGAFGLRPAVLVLATGTAAVAAGVILLPAFRLLERPGAPPSVSASTPDPGGSADELLARIPARESGVATQAER